MYSCTSFGTKLGGGIGTALTGWLLAASGFNGEVATQSASCLSMLHFMYLWLPVILALVITFIMTKMNVEKANKELRAKRLNGYVEKMKIFSFLLQMGMIKNKKGNQL